MGNVREVERLPRIVQEELHDMLDTRELVAASLTDNEAKIQRHSQEFAADMSEMSQMTMLTQRTMSSRQRSS